MASRARDMTGPALARKRRARSSSRVPPPASIDVGYLADTIFELEQSLRCQDLELSPRDRAELIAETYLNAVEAGAPPEQRDIDRMVWMKAR